MTTPTRSVTAGWRDLARVAALVLFIIAAIGAFASGWLTHETESGVAYAGLACLAASFIP